MKETRYVALVRLCSLWSYSVVRITISLRQLSFECVPVVSVRHKIDRIQVWTRSKDNVEVLNSIAKKLDKLLDLGNEPTIGLEFQVSSGTLCPTSLIPCFIICLLILLVAVPLRG